MTRGIIVFVSRARSPTLNGLHCRQRQDLFREKTVLKGKRPRMLAAAAAAVLFRRWHAFPPVGLQVDNTHIQTAERQRQARRKPDRSASAIV